MSPVAIVVRYQAVAGKGDEVAALHFTGIAVARIRPLLADRSIEFCEVVAPSG
jgi:hypothetical protein